MLASSSPRVSFRERDEYSKPRYGYERDKGITSTQESENNTPRSRAQGEFSGSYDREGHHLKSNGTPDMRFKENREEFEGEGYEYTNQERGRSSGQRQGEYSNQTDRADSGSKTINLKSKSGKIGMKEGKSQDKMGKIRRSQEKDQKISSQKSKSKGRGKSEHKKSDGTPDMRYKENRDEHSGEGYENTTSRNSTLLNKANLGIVEGNTPGEHSGKYDEERHHLKNNGQPDMRFKENRDEFSGQGFETKRDERGNSIITPRYKMDEDSLDKTIFYSRRRPPTPYALYVRDNASNMKKENTDMDMNEVFRQLGEQWRESDDEYKKKFYDMYNEEVRRFEEMNKIPHRGPLAFRKLAQKRGLKIDTDLKYSKRGKYSSSGKNRFEQQDTKEEDDEEDSAEDYTPDNEEENMNPNQGITA